MSNTILDTIIAAKQQEVNGRKAQVPRTSLEASDWFTRPTVSLRARVERLSGRAIIAEFKRKSPSKGWIQAQADVASVTSGYAEAGAAGISVLTDALFFGAQDTDFAVARQVTVPLLRKEFVVDEYQVLESKAMGADAILLIAACLTIAQTQALAKLARSLNLDVLLELHTEEELDHLNPWVTLVGINNRNLKDFNVSLDHSVQLAERLPKAIPKIGESGIHDIADIHRLQEAGFDGFLIGERFMREPEPAIALAALVNQLNMPNHAR